ncbi:MAG: hypothetical protein ORN85_00290 [Sediminibacterium sp.]|nr:hypothetical protein [Sediminibacterium sp.]
MKSLFLILLSVFCFKAFSQEQNLADFQPLNYQEAGHALLYCHEVNCTEDQVNLLFEKYLKLKPPANHLCYTILKVRHLHTESNAKYVKSVGFNYYNASKKVRVALEEKNINPQIKLILVSNNK